MRKTWNATFRKVLLIAGSAVLALVLLALLLTAAFGDRVAMAAVQSLNKQLAVPVDLDPDGVRFSLLRDFPNASLSFHGLRIPHAFPEAQSAMATEGQDLDAEPLQEEGFLALERLALEFSPLDLLRGRYRIRHLRLENGRLHGIRRSDGTVNFRFWKTADKTPDQTLNLDLQRLELHRVAIRWEDAQSGSMLSMDLEHAQAQGSLEDGLLQAAVQAEGLWHQGQMGNSRFPYQTPIQLQFNLEDLAVLGGSTWRCPDFALQLSGIRVSGSAESQSEDLVLDLAALGNAKDLRDVLLPLLPQTPSTQAQRTVLASLEARGQLTLTAKSRWQKGLHPGTNKSAEPIYEAGLSWTNGRLRHRHWGLDIDRMSLHASVSNQNGFQLAIKDFAARQAGAVLHMGLTMDGLGQEAQLDLHADGRIEASSLGTLLALAGLPGPYGDWTDWKGRLHLEDVHIHGPWLSPEARQLGHLHAAGSLALDGFSWKRDDARWTLESGRLRLHEREAHVEAARLRGPSTEAELDVLVQDFLPALLQAPYKASDGSSRGILPRIQGRIEAKSVDFEAFLALLKPREEGVHAMQLAERSRSVPSILQLPRLAGEVDIHIEAFEHKDLHLQNVESQWRLLPGYWKAERIRLDGMQGSAQGQAALRDRPQGGILLELEGHVQRVEVQEVFRQFNDFGQATLTTEHLSGRLDGDLEHVRAVWNSEGHFVEEELVVQAEVRVQDGILQDFEPVMALSRFVDVRDLERIQFSHLHNRIRIEERMVMLPAMDIRSNALNLRLSGSHSFDNQVDYAVQLGLLDLLGKKFRKRHRDQPFEERQKDGGLNLFVHMMGPASSPSMAFNQRETRAAFKDQANGLFDRSPSRARQREPGQDRGRGIPDARSASSGPASNGTSIHARPSEHGSSGHDADRMDQEHTDQEQKPKDRFGPGNGSKGGAEAGSDWEFIDWEDNAEGRPAGTGANPP